MVDTATATELPAAGTEPTPRDSARLLTVVAIAAVVLLAVAIRAVTLTSALPYTNYIDERFTLTGSSHQIAESTWDSGHETNLSSKYVAYLYPSFLMDATSLSAYAYSAATGNTGELRSGARATLASEYAEVIEPRSMVLSGRIIVLLLSALMTLLVALLGIRLRGRAVGLIAAFFVAVLPIFVTRGSIVIVDTPAACFAIAALYCAARITDASWRRQLVTWAALGGAASALAFTSKYTIATVLLSVLTVVAFRRDRSPRERMLLGGAALAAFIGVSVVVMPALVFRTSIVIDTLRWQQRVYNARATASYWEQIRTTKEFGIALLIAAVIGIGLLLRSRRWRSLTIGYLVFAVVTIAVLAQAEFQPLRNLLPLVPFLAIAAATSVVTVVRWVGARFNLARVVQLGAAAVLAIALAWFPVMHGTKPYISALRKTTDTRVPVREWIEQHAAAGDRVLVAEELGFLPTELAQICAHVVVGSQAVPAPVNQYDWVLVGDMGAGHGATPWGAAIAPRPQVLRVGDVALPGLPPKVLLSDAWHANRETIRVYGHDGAAAQPRDPRPCPQSDHSVQRLDDLRPLATPGSASVREGDTGTTVMHVPIALSRASKHPITLSWRTFAPSGSKRTNAAAGRDFEPAAGTVVFEPGQTRVSVPVTVLGDTVPEANEKVFVLFTTTTGDVKVGGFSGIAQGVIVDDD